MTVQTPTSVSGPYAGTGAQVAFTFAFKIFAESDLEVIETSAAGVETVKALTTHYTVNAGPWPSGGTVTMLIAPASGTKLTLRRKLAKTQTTDYITGGKFPAEAHETALDRAVMLLQQIQADLDRAMLVQASEGTAPADLVLPFARANKFAAYDANKKPIAAAGTSANLGPVSAYIDTLLSAATPAGAQRILQTPLSSFLVATSSTYNMLQSDMGAILVPFSASIAQIYNLPQASAAIAGLIVTFANTGSAKQTINAFAGDVIKLRGIGTAPTITILADAQDRTQTVSLSCSNGTGGFQWAIVAGSPDYTAFPRLIDGRMRFLSNFIDNHGMQTSSRNGSGLWLKDSAGQWHLTSVPDGLTTNALNCTINGTPGQKMTNDVNYLAYAYLNNGVFAIDFSATIETIDAETGFTIKTGDATRRCIGGANHISAGESTNVIGTANNGSGAIRITVVSTSGFTSGNTVVVAGVGGTTEANGTWVGTKINSTQIDLVGTTFVNPWTSGGTLTSCIGLGINAGTQNNVGSFFERQTLVLSSLPPDSTTNTGNWVKITTHITSISFWQWADGATAMLQAAGSVNNALANVNSYVGILKDGSGTPLPTALQQWGPTANNQYAPFNATLDSSIDGTDGVHRYDFAIRTQTSPNNCAVNGVRFTALVVV